MGEEVHVQAEDVGIEERLRDEGLLNDGVGGTEEQDGGPAAAGAASELANEKRTAAVHGREDNDQGKPGSGKIAEEEFRDDGREEKEREGGGDGSIRMRRGRVGHECLICGTRFEK